MVQRPHMHVDLVDFDMSVNAVSVLTYAEIPITGSSIDTGASELPGDGRWQAANLEAEGANRAGKH